MKPPSLVRLATALRHAAAIAALFSTCGATAAVLIAPNDPALQYTGRIDFAQPSAPVITWAASSIAANFTGTSLAVILDDQDGKNSFNVFLDGDLDHPIVLHCDKGVRTYPVADNLAGEKHGLLITKRTEGGEGATVFRGLQLADAASLLPPPKRPPHRLEIYGDSISSGMANEAADGAPDDNPREKNSFLAYGSIAARDLNCELHLISQSGIGIMISWFNFTMPQFFDQMSAVGNNDTHWDFSSWTPEVVVINIFQNDCWLIDDQHRLQPEPTDEQRIQAYVDFVQTIRAKYPQARFICALGSMDATRPGRKWPGYIEAAVQRIKTADASARIDTLFFEFTGYGAHPRVAQHRANAAKLAAFIRGKMGW